MTKIKICGLQTREAVETASSLKVDYIGFVFAESRRRIGPEAVLQITQGIQTPKRIGVFVNDSIERMLEIAEIAKLDGFQLHGTESPSDCLTLKEKSGKQVWKAWRVSSTPDVASLRPYHQLLDAVILDSYHPDQMGGTGQTFSWNIIQDYKLALPQTRLFVAGGLHEANVGQLVKQYRPDGVDVSSGVETNGTKDLTKIKGFVHKARESA